MEYLDIVDEYGNKTGEILDRETAHDLNKLHWEVTVYVVNKNGQLLLEKRSASKRYSPNKWAPCAGHVMSGEEVDVAACRELKEELNLEIKPEDLHFIKTLKRSSKYTETFINNEFDDLYIVRTDKRIEDMKFQEEEISEIMYVPYKQFKKMVEKHQSDLLRHDDEFEIIFKMFDCEFDK